MAKNKRRKAPSKNGAVIALCVVFLLTLCAGYLSLCGLPLGKPYYVAPWLPVTDSRTGRLTEALSLGLDLNGGVFVEFDAERPEDMNDGAFATAMENTVANLQSRLTGSGYTEATVQQINDGRGLRVEVPISLGQDVSSTDQIRAVEELLGRTARLSFTGPDGSEFMTGEDVRGASSGWDTQTGKGYCIFLDLTDTGKRLFGAMTVQSQGQQIAIWLDNEQLLSATVNEPILDGSVMITGNYTADEASRVASMISSGALPLTLHESNSSTVSATLGTNALSTAVKAGLIGIAVIMVIMLLRYRLNGLVASWALTIYVILLFLLIAVIPGIQITLPGLAGIVLGIGMAVDANVIIYERFNEELRAGRTAKAAAEAGFKNAMSAILDANVTTLIAGVVLMIFGTGPVQGFAKTLLLGVVISMFSAVVVTRFLMKRFIIAGASNPALFCRMPAQANEEVQ